MPISDATREEARRLVQRYPVARSALLPLLHLVQSDEGYVSEDGIGFCARTLDLTKAEVGAVASFYTMFKREPFGEYLLSVCTNPTCKIAGAQGIYDAYVERCGGHVDTEAGVMVEHAECLGICDAAPVVQINYEMYGPLTHDQAMDLLDKTKAGEPPTSNWSGEVPATFRDVERQLSGIDDGVDQELAEAARLQVAAAAPPAYRTGETELPVTHPGADRAGYGGAAFRSVSGLGDAGRSPDEGPPPDDVEVVDDLADAGTGVASELAEHVTTDEPAGEPPAVQEQAPLDDSGATPAEAETGVPSGVEQDPSTSTAGEGGPDEQLDEPDAASGDDAGDEEA